jgi:hypothetical protein
MDNMDRIVAAGVAGWLASRKGRRADEGVLLGIGLGPLGLFIEALMPPQPPPPSPVTTGLLAVAQFIIDLIPPVIKLRGELLTDIDKCCLELVETRRLFHASACGLLTDIETKYRNRIIRMIDDSIRRLEAAKLKASVTESIADVESIRGELLEGYHWLKTTLYHEVATFEVLRAKVGILGYLKAIHAAFVQHDGELLALDELPDKEARHRDAMLDRSDAARAYFQDSARLVKQSNRIADVQTVGVRIDKNCRKMYARMQKDLRWLAGRLAG